MINCGFGFKSLVYHSTLWLSVFYFVAFVYVLYPITVDNGNGLGVFIVVLFTTVGLVFFFLFIGYVVTQPNLPATS